MKLEFPLRDMNSAPEVFARSEKTLGMVPNLMRVMTTSPAAASAYLDLTERLAQSSLSPEEQGVALLTISRFHACDYCMAAHSMTGRMAGLSDAVVDALREDRSLPDERLESLRRFVVAVLEHRGWVPESDQEAFRRAGFDEVAALDVTLAVALKTLSNYTNHLATTPLDEALQNERWVAPEPR